MAKWILDRSYYPSPKMATEAPPERIAYISMLNPRENGAPALGYKCRSRIERLRLTGSVAATQSGPWNVGVTGTSNVNVTNSALPVSGTVQAQQNGAWNVGLTGTPTVNLNTSPSSPLIAAPVQPAASQPFSAHFDYSGGTYSVKPMGRHEDCCRRGSQFYVCLPGLQFASRPQKKGCQKCKV